MKELSMYKLIMKQEMSNKINVYVWCCTGPFLVTKQTILHGGRQCITPWYSNSS